MKTHKRLFWIVGGLLLLVIGLVVGWLDITGRLPWQRGKLYQDPQGRFSMQVDPNWEQVETDAPYALFQLPDPPMHVYVMVVQANTVKDAFSRALKTAGFDPGLVTGGSSASIGDWQAYQQDDSAGLTYGMLGQIVGENAYVVIARADQPGVGVENMGVIRVISSMKIDGKKEVAFQNYGDLEAFVRQQVDQRAGSVSLALIHQGQIVYTYTYGKANPVDGIAADPQTIYMFGSMTKPFTATALMQLVEQDKVNLDAWPGKYIPEFPQGWKVTVRQLLDHSACLADSERLDHGLITRTGESFVTLKEVFTQYVKDYPNLVCEPGKASLYSNPHYLALARIIEEVSGEAYDTYVVDHILKPLSMDSTGFQITAANSRYAKGQYPADQVDLLVASLNAYRGPGQESLILQKGQTYATLADYNILPPWGGLRGTPGDVTHFLQMYLNHGRYGDIQILKPETVAAMQQMQKSTDGSPLGFGLSWMMEKDHLGDFIYHSGGGPGLETIMGYYPNLDLGVVVMGNVGGYQPEKIAEGLINIWINRK